jgi:hypothetical protein
MGCGVGVAGAAGVPAGVADVKMDAFGMAEARGSGSDRLAVAPDGGPNCGSFNSSGSSGWMFCQTRESCFHG